MYNFGKIPPRDLESFGVSGLLGEDCRVFYENIFSTQHLGRISDLISARLRKAAPDELRLRTLMLFATFEAYRAQKKGTIESTEQPLLLEFGIDPEKIAIGISFNLPEGNSVNLEGLAARIQNRVPIDPFETMLGNLLLHAERIVLRLNPENRRCEIVTLLGLPGKIDDASLTSGHAIEVVKIEQQKEEIPRAKEYTALGDLDYPALLQTNKEVTGAATEEGEKVVTVTGNEDSTELADAIRVRGEKAPVEDQERVVSGGGKKPSDEKILVKGNNEENPEVVTRFHTDKSEEQKEARTVIKGTTQKVQQRVFKIAGDTPEQRAAKADHELVNVSGGPSDSVVRAYENKVKELQYKLSLLQAQQKAQAGNSEPSEIAPPPTEDTAIADEAAPSETGVFGKIWPFKKKKEPSVAVAEPKKPKEESEKVLDEIESVGVEKSDVIVIPGEKKDEEEASAATLVTEIQSGGLDKTLIRAKQEIPIIKKEIPSSKAQKWVDNLMGEMTAEKSRLNELAKKLGITVRQKEFEFRNREVSLQEELKRRDEMIRQKNVALVRTKDQLAQLTMNFERLKSAKGSADESGYRQKYNTSQKILLQSKEENALQSKRIDELKTAVTELQVASKATGTKSEEYQEVQGKLNQAQRQVEEFKKSHQQLLDRLEEAKKMRLGGAGNVEDLKKRLEASMRLATDKKREAEKLKPKVDELNRETVRLKMEMGRLQAENKILRGAVGRPGLAKPSSGDKEGSGTSGSGSSAA